MNSFKQEIEKYNIWIDNLWLDENDLSKEIKGVLTELPYLSDKELMQTCNRTREQVISCLYTIQYI
jgi:hypothetical protein